MAEPWRNGVWRNSLIGFDGMYVNGMYRNLLTDFQMVVVL